MSESEKLHSYLEQGEFGKGSLCQPEAQLKYIHVQYGNLH